jgi:photosystem II stability/assembly factor-like uncharacterized protein
MSRSASHLVLSAFAALGASALLSSVAVAQARDSAMINQSANPLLASFRFRSIGPASMGGRVDDIEAAPSDPSIIYVGYATGGVFKSDNNATTFEPVFDTYGSASIGDIAIHPTNPSIVYVGTGEPNNRQSSTYGDGIYKTEDGGKTFKNIGLRETQTIARIVIDPRHPDVVYVASPGHLFGPSADRGIYKTTDGGKSWSKIKYIDENTGFTDIAIDPSNSNVLYAASYQRRRSGCCFNGGGPGSALWKSDDAGRTWNRLTNGLPKSEYGRIGLDVARSNPNVIYAEIEVADAEPAATPPAATAGAGRGGAYDWCNNAGPGRGFGGGRGGAAAAPADTNRTPPALDGERSGIFRSDNKGRTWTAVSNCNARSMYFSQIRVDPTNDKTIYVAGVHPGRSLDGGKTFLQLDAAGGFFNMGEDQHAFWIDPHDSKHILRGNDAGFMVSWDQGKTWEYVRTMATGQAYWVAADMGHPYYVYTGMQDNDSWAGPSATRGRIGITGKDWFHLTGGDGFQTAVDPTDSHIIYSSSQDGSVSRTDVRTGKSQSIRPVAPPAPAAGGRGGNGRGRGAGGAPPVATEATASPCVDGRIVSPAAATGGRGGRGGAANVLNAQPGETYRFNWNTPLLMSPHDPNTIWIGGNRLFKSTNRGESWTESADLTKQVDRCTVTLMGVSGTLPQLSKNDGATSFSTLIAVSESPVTAGVVWVGTDDGNLQVSRDGGVTFSNVSANVTGLPQDALGGANPYWISRIDASHFDAGTAYVAIDGHRSDDMKPYVLVTHDYGKTFQNISATLPPFGNVQVVREDPKNKDLLYAGTDLGIFISLDAGAHWQKFMNNYPTVRTDDILIHPRDGDLIAASHGRSLWIADDITALQQFTPAVAAQDVALFDVRPAIAYLFDIRTDADVGGDKKFEGENPARGTAISYYLKAPVSGGVTLSVLDPSGRTLCTSSAPSDAGIHRVQWALVSPMIAAAGNGRGGAGGGGGAAGAPDTSCSGTTGRGGAAAIKPGVYTAKLTVGGRDYLKPVTVLEDSWMGER